MATDDLGRLAQHLRGVETDYGPLLDLVGGSRFVLFGTDRQPVVGVSLGRDDKSSILLSPR